VSQTRVLAHQRRSREVHRVPIAPPDGTEIAFKDRDGGAAVTCRLGVLGLNRGRWRLGEIRSVDHRVE
jgi:hypothetical protein